MQESLGKKTARDVFFKECLGGWFTPEQRRAGAYLGLLGAEQHELPYLDALGFARHNVRSVENNWETYQVQRGWQAGISLWYGEMNSYLRDLLHHDEQSIVVNADIEGSFLTNLDASLTSVILYCWLRPTAALATYSTVGRDARMLAEGLKSLAVLAWLDQPVTEELVSGLYTSYLPRTDNPIRMVLRDLFWIRSMIENTMLASVWVDVMRFDTMRRFLAAESQLWEMLKTEAGGDLTLADIRHVVTTANGQNGFRRLRTEPRLGLWIAALVTVLYKAQSPFSHRCYFAKTEWLQGGIDLASWYQQLAATFLGRKLVYADRTGHRQDLIIPAGRPPLGDREPIFDTSYLTHRPRVMSVRRPDSAFYDTVQQLRQRYHALSPLPAPAIPIGEEVTSDMPTQIKWLEDGTLSQAGKDELKRYGRECPTLTALEIHRLLPDRVKRIVPVASVTAHIAVARRGLNRNGHTNGRP